MGFAQLPSARVLAFPVACAGDLRRSQLVSRPTASSGFDPVTRQPIRQPLLDPHDTVFRFHRRAAYFPKTGDLASHQPTATAAANCFSLRAQLRDRSRDGYLRQRPYRQGHREPASGRSAAIPQPGRRVSADASAFGPNLQPLLLERLPDLEALPFHSRLYRRPHRSVWRAPASRFRRSVPIQRPLAADSATLADRDRDSTAGFRLGVGLMQRSRLGRLLPGLASDHIHRIAFRDPDRACPRFADACKPSTVSADAKKPPLPSVCKKLHLSKQFAGYYEVD